MRQPESVRESGEYTRKISATGSASEHDRFGQRRENRQDLPASAPAGPVLRTIVKTRRVLLIVAVVAALAGAVLTVRQSRKGQATGPAAKNSPPVAIEDGKTIDFSSGKPVVKDSTQDKAAIDKAVKEMDDAAKDVTFGPLPAAAETKK